MPPDLWLTEPSSDGQKIKRRGLLNMKLDHIELLWESLSQFEKEKLTFADFLDRLGKSLETATVAEAKLIGETTRELDFVLTKSASRTGKVRKIISRLKSNLVTQLKAKAA